MDSQSPARRDPPSPGVYPVRLSDCIEELVKFTLAASLEGVSGESATLEGVSSKRAHVALSKDYCAGLLRDEPLPLAAHNPSGSSGGVPVYPLYKHLARAIEQCITFGSFTRMPTLTGAIPLDETLKSKQNEWNKLIVGKGSELLKMFDSVEFELHVQEPYFLQLRTGLKTVEGRCAVGDYNRIPPGASLLFNKCLLLKVQDIRRYSSFHEMLQIETLQHCLPGVETMEEGVQAYRKFYTEEKEKSNGVLAISVFRLSSQPYISMAELLNGLSYDGIGCLLGIIHTVGTVHDALPPPRSILSASAIKPHRLNVKENSLTVAARALTKHVSRSSEGWWGCMSGNDSKKNKLASEAVNRLLTECSWMNVHMLPSYESVVEIRVPEGYGARWSEDGSVFIGFLEPYMEEGHSKGWKQ